jgi:hypothetical protein
MPAYEYTQRCSGSVFIPDISESVLSATFALSFAETKFTISKPLQRCTRSIHDHLGYQSQSTCELDLYIRGSFGMSMEAELRVSS